MHKHFRLRSLTRASLSVCAAIAWDVDRAFQLLRHFSIPKMELQNFRSTGSIHNQKSMLPFPVFI
jgi:hypothetical protein